jgi:hypothetical protein
MAQLTIRYRTYLKEAVVEALRQVFANHPDPSFRNTQVRIGYAIERAQLSNSIIVRYLERSIRNAGIGHAEWELISEEGASPEIWQRFKHFLYTGDLEFEIVTLSSRDRDWLADAMVNIIGMADTESYMAAFLNRIYNPDVTTEPSSKTHAINLRSDDFSGGGDVEGPAPWMAEDVFVYRTSFRVPVFGEFYSRELGQGQTYGKVTSIEAYPYMEDFESVPDPNPEDPSPWVDLEGIEIT